MSNTAEEILGALRSAVVALGDLTPEGEPVEPYIADAKSFATQAGVCVEKFMITHGMEVPVDPSKPVPAEAPLETPNDRDTTAGPQDRVQLRGGPELPERVPAAVRGRKGGAEAVSRPTRR
jgi:hypothetical protein